MALQASGMAASDAEKAVFLGLHNQYRCMHGTADVVWSDAVAADAESYIAGMTGLETRACWMRWRPACSPARRGTEACACACVVPEMEHSDSYNIAPPAGPAGENLYSSATATAAASTNGWCAQ